MSYRPDAEAHRLAWERAKRVSPSETGRLQNDPHRAAIAHRAADPASILDDSEALAELEESYRRSADGWPDPALAMRRIREVVITFVDQLTPALRRIGEVMQQVTVELGKVTQPTQRRRHGWASECPRHGPTKGGLCRRCHR